MDNPLQAYTLFKQESPDPYKNKRTSLLFAWDQKIAYLQRRGSLWQPAPFPLQKDVIKSNESGPQLQKEQGLCLTFWLYPILSCHVIELTWLQADVMCSVSEGAALNRRSLAQRLTCGASDKHD